MHMQQKLIFKTPVVQGLYIVISAYFEKSWTDFTPQMF